MLLKIKPKVCFKIVNHLKNTWAGLNTNKTHLKKICKHNFFFLIYRCKSYPDIFFRSWKIVSPGGLVESAVEGILGSKGCFLFSLAGRVKSSGVLRRWKDSPQETVNVVRCPFLKSMLLPRYMEGGGCLIIIPHILWLHFLYLLK